jgi:hypothetical protein
MTLRQHRNLLAKDNTAFALEGHTGGVSMELAHEVSLAIESLQHLSDLAMGLEDLRNAASGISMANPQHLLLIEAGLNLAHAGTFHTASADEPSLEAYLGSEVSLEGLNQRIRALIASILQALKIIGERLLEFLESLVTDLGQLETRLEHVQYEADDVGGKFPNHPQVALGNDVYGVATDHGYPTDGHRLVATLSLLSIQSKMVYEQYVPAMQLIGRALSAELKKTDAIAKNPEAWLTELNTKLSVYNVDAFKSHVGKTSNLMDSRYPMGSAIAAQPLPGMRSMVFVDGSRRRDEDRNPVIKEAYDRQASTVELVRANGGRSFDPGSASMATMPVTVIHDALRAVHGLIGDMKTHLGHGAKRELKGTLRELQTAAEQMSTRDPDSSEFLTVGLQYVMAYQRWIKLQADMLALVYNVSRSTVNVCVRNLHAYK